MKVKAVKVNRAHYFLTDPRSLKTYNKFVVVGDFNIDYNCHETSIDVKLYVNGISSLGCEQLVTCPTRVSFSRKSILDHIYIDCSMFNEIFTTAVIECDISDHYPIFVGLNLPLKRKNTRRPLITFNKSKWVFLTHKATY